MYCLRLNHKNTKHPLITEEKQIEILFRYNIFNKIIGKN